MLYWWIIFSTEKWYLNRIIDHEKDIQNYPECYLISRILNKWVFLKLRPWNAEIGWSNCKITRVEIV